MTTSPILVTLKNGTTGMPDAIVRTTMISLNHLMDVDPIAFYDLVASARDANYQLFGDSGQTLKGLALIRAVNPDGTAQHHSSVRDIVLSAVEGNGLQMNLVWPVAD